MPARSRRKPQIPKQYVNEPELVNAVIQARPIQMATGDDDAIEWLLQNHRMSAQPAANVINHVTFQYEAMYPEGHQRLSELTDILGERRIRSQIRRGIRLQIVQRDGDECRHCRRQVNGHNSVMDRIDHGKGDQIENLHIICRRRIRLKGDEPWAEFQSECREHFGDKYTLRNVEAMFGTGDHQLDQARIKTLGEAGQCAKCRWIIIGDGGLNGNDECAHCVVGAPRHPELQFPPDEYATWQ